MSRAEQKGNPGSNEVSDDVAGLGGIAADAARVVSIGGGESLPNKVIRSRVSFSVKLTAWNF